jgi:hypothetical protein
MNVRIIIPAFVCAAMLSACKSQRIAATGAQPAGNTTVTATPAPENAAPAASNTNTGGVLRTNSNATDNAQETTAE